MTATTSDEELMLRYRDGDAAAFGELYRRHSKGLYLFVVWRSPQRGWADEIVQDSWASLHQARARYQPQASFRTYLFQIARNRLIDLIRQNERVVLACDFGPDGGAAFDTLPAEDGGSGNPELQLDRKQWAVRLHAALRALPEEQREAVVLQQFNGMSLEEIAQLVGTPAETVKTRLRYAMQKLRHHVALRTEEGGRP